MTNELIKNIAEASKNARQIYFLYIGFLAYCVLTVVTTSDRQIILNETARLPIVNLDVSLDWFFILAPVIAILVFLYFHSYIQRLKGLKNKLRKKNHKIEPEHIYLWIINIAENPEPGAVGKLQTFIAKFSLWALLPLVLIIIASWYVKKHDPILSYVVVLIAIVGTLLVLWLWCHYEGVKFSVRGMPEIVYKNLGKMGLGTLVIMFELFLLFFMIPWAMEGGKYKWLKPLVCVNLSYQKLVTEPKTHYEGIYWRYLKGAHLEGASLINTVLKRSDLKQAQLQKANLFNANLQGANLLGANLRGVNLFNANLQEADLRSVNLQGANLWRANLQEANLLSAYLQKADFSDTNLQKAVLKSANLQGADLRSANLQGANLFYANLQKAKLVSANLQEADLGSVNLQGANLFNANLQKAKLVSANLQGANLEHADLQGANLTRANLQGVKHLEVEQLANVKTLYEAKLDKALYDQIKKNHPHLLEEPK